MPDFHVHKSVVIEAAPSSVYPLIRDFRMWPTWSPWLQAEPDCRLKYADDGRSYDWEGEVVGSGQMEILEETPDQFIDCRLTFLKPFKSDNRTAFKLEAKGGGTLLTWTMTGSLPWFLFWMKGMMTAFIGMDYVRGLAMLKDLAEIGNVPSKLEFLGEQSSAELTYVGIRNECPIACIGEAMPIDFEKLAAWRKRARMPKDGRIIAIYHKWNATKGVVSYTAAIEIPNPPTHLPTGMIAGALPDTQVYSIRHTGPYHHLGNAWSAGLMHGRSKQFRQNKKIHPFEIYEIDPTRTPESGHRTLVQFPLK